MAGRQKASLNPSVALYGDGRVANGDAANKEQNRLTAMRLQSDAANEIWRAEYPNIPIPKGYGAWDIKVNGLRAKGWRWSKKQWNKTKPDPKAVEWFGEWAKNNGYEVAK